MGGEEEDADADAEVEVEVEPRRSCGSERRSWFRGSRRRRLCRVGRSAASSSTTTTGASTSGGDGVRGSGGDGFSVRGGTCLAGRSEGGRGGRVACSCSSRNAWISSTVGWKERLWWGYGGGGSCGNESFRGSIRMIGRSPVSFSRG